MTVPRATVRPVRSLFVFLLFPEMSPLLLDPCMTSSVPVVGSRTRVTSFVFGTRVCAAVAAGIRLRAKRVSAKWARTRRDEGQKGQEFHRVLHGILKQEEKVVCLVPLCVTLCASKYQPSNRISSPFFHSLNSRRETKVRAPRRGVPCSRAGGPSVPDCEARTGEQIVGSAV